MAVPGGATRQLLLHGIVGGMIAGIVFLLFEMFVSVALGGPFLMPLIMIGSIVLGTQALSPAFPLATAALAGIFLHLTLSAIFGVTFVYLLAFGRQLGASGPMLLLYGSLFGLALWIVNFQILGRFLWPQFLMADQLWMGFIAHTFFYGTVIGGYIAAVRPGQVERPSQ